MGQESKTCTRKRQYVSYFVFHMCDNQATKESLDRFRHFRNYYWGENRIKLRIEGGKTFSILDLTPADLEELNHGSIKILFIRDEYTLAYDAIVKRISELGKRVVFLFTGQPGTGL